MDVQLKIHQAKYEIQFSYSLTPGTRVSSWILEFFCGEDLAADLLYGVNGGIERRSCFSVVFLA